jgi:hypothetical protein
MLGTGSPTLHLVSVKRPKNVPPPQHLTPSPPVPKPEKKGLAAPPDGEEERLDPTRYGDWEKDGKAVDF